MKKKKMFLRHLNCDEIVDCIRYDMKYFCSFASAEFPLHKRKKKKHLPIGS